MPFEIGLQLGQKELAALVKILYADGLGLEIGRLKVALVFLGLLP